MRYTGPAEIDAGALVTRSGNGGQQLLLIYRANYGDWTLPKGHLEDGETFADAAVREVREETGLEVRLIGLAGATAYERDGNAKPVVYFYADVVGPAAQEHPDNVPIEWLDLHDAFSRLSHKGEREFVASVLMSADVSPGRVSRPWTAMRERGVRVGRILVHLDLLDIDLDALERRARSQKPGSTLERGWVDDARASLRLAHGYADRHRIDDAWDAAQACQRHAFHGYTADELIARATALKEEAAAKLSGWRLAAVQKQLTPVLATTDQAAAQPAEATTGPATDLAARVSAAQEIFDEHTTNVYKRLRLAGSRLVVGAVLLILLLVALWRAVAVDAFAAAGPPPVLSEGLMIVGVMVLGMIGAALSITLSSARGMTTRRLYELTTARVALPLARLAVGAAAAVVVVAAVQLNVLSLGPAWSVLVAIPAGFSERLLGRVVEGLDTAAGKP